MRRLAAALVLSVVLTACGASAITSDDLTPYAGAYTLRTINDFPLPYAILQSTALRLEITDETFALAANGSFNDVTHYRRTASDLIDFPADTLTGTYTIRGGTIQFTTTAGDKFAGQVGLTTFSILGNATTFIYAK